MDVSTHTAISNVESTAGASTGDVSSMGGRADHRSPMSMGHLGASTLSMRAKAARKRKVNAQHNSNFRAGYVPVEEDALHRTGIRGRKRYFLYCIITILVIVAVLNIAVTAWLLYILGMTHYGMSSVELTTLHGREFLRVLAEARIITMSMNGAPIGARHNSNISLKAQESSLNMESRSRIKRSSLKLEGNNVTLTTDAFCIETKGKKNCLPSMAVNFDIDNLRVDCVTAKNIYGIKMYQGLHLDSTALDVDITGNKSVDIKSGNETDLTGHHVLMESQMSVVLEGRNGIYLNVPSLKNPITSSGAPSLKVCVCKSGKIFTVGVPPNGQVSCDITPELDKVCGI